MTTLGDNSGGGPLRLFGVPVMLSAADATALAKGLTVIRDAQAATLPPPRSAVAGPDMVLDADLAMLRHWFDPVAKGERVREALAALPRVQVAFPYCEEPLVLSVPDAPGERSDSLGARMLLTPEGAVLLRLLRQAVSRADAAGGVPGEPIRLNSDDMLQALLDLTAVYRVWTRQRVDQVVALLSKEPSTLRPAAAGLLLVLMINRNTSPSRALPRPKDPRELAAVSDAISGPALAYARTLTNSDRASAAGLDLYRGWALGELTRRLGPALHTGLKEGIYLDPSAEDEALRRLADDVARRPAAARGRTQAAVDMALAAYDKARPTLAGLALAHDLPSNTRRIRAALIEAAANVPPQPA